MSEYGQGNGETYNTQQYAQDQSQQPAAITGGGADFTKIEPAHMDEPQSRHRDRDRGRGDRGGDRGRDRSSERRSRRKRSRSRDRGDRRRRSRDRRRSRSRDKRSRSKDRRRSRRSRSNDERGPEEAMEDREAERQRAKDRHKSKRRTASMWWDVAPRGFEHISPLQYKAMQAAGQVPTVGAPPPALGAATEALTIPPPSQPAASQMTRQARRLYIGSIPFGISEDAMLRFFNEKMAAAGLGTAAGPPVLAVQINMDKNFAFVEFRSVEETTKAMALDGIMLQSQSLKIRRPKDYSPLGFSSSDLVTHLPGVVSTVVQDGPWKVFCGGLPTYLSDDQVKELLSSFGDLRAFNLVKDSGTTFSKGYCFFEYVNHEITDVAIAGLNGMQIGDKKLVVQRASVGAKPGDMLMDQALEAGLAQPINIPGLCVAGTMQEATEVLCLMNMVTEEELMDDEEYEGIMEDVREECEKYGDVKSLEIPRPVDGLPVPGVGKIFVEFVDAGDCQSAHSSLAGRKFANRVVVASFFPLSQYKQKYFIAE
ncbi:splicing factor U2AF 50 kDa subunit-like [Halichondria panicea]|uniref:splicing factor U2AF 50 kDa subunit-like n=1 Tax=Halichondria panicea TaxID=6063 RepID=UPI00312B9CFA